MAKVNSGTGWLIKKTNHLNMLEWCRTCAAIFDESILIPAFDQIQITTKANIEFQLASELISLDIKIEEDDNLPQQVCINCVKQLTSIHTFRQICNESQMKLKEIFSSKNSSPCLADDIDEVQHVERTKPSSLLHNSTGDETELKQNVDKSDGIEEEESTPNIKAKVSSSLVESSESDTDEEETSSSNDDIDLGDDDDIQISTDEENETTDIDSDDPVMEPKIDLENEEATLNKRKQLLSINLDEIMRRRMVHCNLGIIPNEKIDAMDDIEYFRNLTGASENRMDTREVSVNLRRISPEELPENIKLHIKSLINKQANNCNKNVLHPEQIIKCTECKKYKRSFRFEADMRICGRLKKLKRFQIATDSEFCCFYCDDKFESKEIITKHILELHPIKSPFLCKICNESFPKAHIRRLHNEKFHREHHNLNTNETPSCDVCGKIFAHKYKLRTHKRTTHPDGNNYECEICLAKFINKHKFKYHLRAHNKNEQFKCNYCEKTFMQAHHRQYHEETHTNIDRPYKCNKCDKDFVHLCEYKVHLKMHEANMSYICEICGKGFAFQYMLNAHKTDHSLTHQCEICGEVCNKRILNLHNFLHKGGSKANGKKLKRKNNKFYTCPISACSAQFVTPSGLQNHIKVHNKNRKYKCEICHRAYKTSNHLKEHINMNHSKAKHYDCPVCKKRFYTSCYLNYHVKSHTERYKCSFCNKSYSKQYIGVHERKHTKEKRCVCMICGERFYYSLALIEHEKKHTVEQRKEMEAKILANNKELIN